MNRYHSEILDWIAQGRIEPAAVPAALRATGMAPSRADWRGFIDSIALWLGAVFCAAAVIFFFAYNWQALGRFAKFGLVEALLLGAVAACWRLGLDRVSGKAALLAATLLVGALLALVGQTYQTGADTFELFAAWAAAVFAWVALSRFGALWLLWLGLLNLTVYFYHHTFGGLFGLLFSTQQLLWVLFVLNTVALCVWEAATHFGVAWLQAERWPQRVLASASGGLITALAVWAVIDVHGVGAEGVIGYLLWLGAAFAMYRHWRPDLFVLAGGVLSAVIVVAAALGNLLLRHDNGGGFLLIGMVVIGMSAAGAWWLKTVAKEQRT
jgi:uncharacterized membrane protein